MNLLQTPTDAKLVEGETSKDTENGTKEKLHSLEKQIRKIRGADAMRMLTFLICVSPELKATDKVQNA